MTEGKGSQKQMFDAETLTMALLDSYDPYSHEGKGLVPPLHVSVTNVFDRAIDGKWAFAHAYSLQSVIEQMVADGYQGPVGQIYARLTSPTIDVLEHAFKILEPDADWALTFASGMAAISALMLTACNQRLGDSIDSSARDVVLTTAPVYGGTHGLTHAYIQRFGFTNHVVDMEDPDALEQAFARFGNRLALVFTETPANPTLDMVDIQALVDQIARLTARYRLGHRPILAVDNTFMGIFQNPLRLGADVCVYSATKYMGGHSDTLCGVLIGKQSPVSCVIKPVVGNTREVSLFKALLTTRTFLGDMLSADVAQRMYAHLQTYPLRMETMSRNAQRVAERLVGHAKIEQLVFPTYLSGRNADIFRKQCLGTGAMIALRLKEDSEAAAFRFLDGLQQCMRAVSLGTTRSLAEHPGAWTHSDIAPSLQVDMGITPGLVRLSIGLGSADEITADLLQALECV